MFTKFAPLAMGNFIPLFLFNQVSNYSELLLTSIAMPTLLKSWSICISLESPFSLLIGHNLKNIDFSLFLTFDMFTEKRNLRYEANSLPCFW